jgi:hypothetical protein
MRPFTKALAATDLGALAEIEPARCWTDDGALRAAILDGGDRAAPLHAAVAALRAGAGVDGVLTVVIEAVSERMLRYDPAGEYDLHDDFGWLDITHGITYANAARWHAAHRPHPDAVRLALWCVFLAHWTGRHEWHTTVGETERIDLGADLAAAGATLQAQALDDANTTAFIVHAHAVKTTTAATEEALRAGSSLPLEAAARFLTAPKLERFVGATVARSIDFISGRAPRDT